MDLRIVRIAATLLFFFSVVLILLNGVDWRYVIAAVLLGIMTGFMWWSDLQAQADLRADRQREEQRTRLARIQAQQGHAGTTAQNPPHPNTTSWS